MTAADPVKVFALVPMDRSVSATGLPAPGGLRLAGRRLLDHTLDRLSRCRLLEGIIVLGPGPLDCSADRVIHHPVSRPFDDLHPMRIAARKWSPTAWRGGLGGMTCYDEILSPAVMAQALEQADATAGLLVGPDWPLVDPVLCDAVIERHRSAPRHYKCTFTQAAPGLAGMLVSTDLMRRMADDRASLGPMLDYQPHHPQIDPTERQTCVQIDPPARDAPVRAIADAPRWLRLIEAALQADPHIDAASAATLMHRLAVAQPWPLPAQLVVELTVDRPSIGPILPQHHVNFKRLPMSLETAADLFDKVARHREQAPDLAVRLGGLGDVLCHRQWADILALARQAGVWGLAVDTDLGVEQGVLDQLLSTPLDAVVVHLNADSEATYGDLMGRPAWKKVCADIQYLLQHRGDPAGQPPGLPWVVPAMVKTRHNVAEMESFVDRWTRFAGMALVTGFQTGGGRIADQSVLDMAGPLRRPCRQLACRMTVHSDGAVPRCDQDWLAEQPLGHLTGHDLPELWQQACRLYDQHCQGQVTGLCADCNQWHRP